MALLYLDDYSPRRVYWATQETVTDWLPTATNTAGSFDLATEGVLRCGKATRGQTLLWTTVDLWTMTYIGGDLIYSFARVGNNCGIIGQHASVVLDTGAYWMGVNKFFLFDGFVKVLACEVNDYVFGNFNTSYGYKVWTLSNPQFGEITWFYPSALATECDSYVTYSYQENHWEFGSLARTCGVTRQFGLLSPAPVMIGSDGKVYDHETGNAHGGVSPYLESGPLLLSEGMTPRYLRDLGSPASVMRIQQIVPDDKTQGDVTVSIYTSMFPDSAETLNGPYTLTSPTSVRLTARQIRLKITEAVAAGWRVGVIRLGAITSGTR